MGSYVMFIERQDLEPTNNSSERDLRPAVMHRKDDRLPLGGRRCLGGIFATVLATARKNRANRFETLCHITGPSPLMTSYQGT